MTITEARDAYLAAVAADVDAQIARAQCDARDPSPEAVARYEAASDAAAETGRARVLASTALDAALRRLRGAL